MTEPIKLPTLPEPPFKAWMTNADAKTYGEQCALASIEADRKDRRDTITEAWAVIDELADDPLVMGLSLASAIRAVAGQARGEPVGYVSSQAVLCNFPICLPANLFQTEDELLQEYPEAIPMPVYAAPQPQQIPEGYRQTIKEFLAALDKANTLDKPNSAWVRPPNVTTGERLQAWEKVNRLRAMLEAAPESKENQ